MHIAGTDTMALQAGSAATEATWATRTFSSWARQRLSLSCVAMLAGSRVGGLD